MAKTGTVYIGNMSYKTTEQELRDLFAPRSIARITIVMDQEQQRPKGFCFVEFANPDDASEVVSTFNGSMFGGRTLKVDFARERTNGNGGGDRRHDKRGKRKGNSDYGW